MTQDDGLLGVPFIGGMAGFAALILSGSWVVAVGVGVSVAMLVGFVLYLIQRCDSVSGRAGGSTGTRPGGLRTQPPRSPK